MILNLVSLNIEEHQAVLFTISKPGSWHPSLFPCYFRSALGDFFSHWHTNHPNPLHLPLQVQPLTCSPLFWLGNQRETSNLTPHYRKRCFYSISKMPVVSKPPALTKSAVYAPSSWHGTSIIPDLICSATAHWSKIIDQTLPVLYPTFSHSTQACYHLILFLVFWLCSVFKWMISEGLCCIRAL